MKIKCQLICVLLISALFSACVSDPLKAPCDASASFCGTKTKINQW